MMDTLFIYGPPASGKSTLGKGLADRLALPFIDLDQVITQDAGCSIPEIFSREGEEGFRRRELSALKDVVQSGRAVVSLGGGALLNPEARAVAEKSGHILCLQLSLSRLEARAANTPGSRPLLEGNRLAQLLSDRAEHYASFKNKVLIESDDLELNIRLLQAAAGNYRITGMGNPYEVHVEEGGIDRLNEYVEPLNLSNRAIVVCDENTRPYANQLCHSLAKKSGIQLTCLTIPPGEESKQMKTVYQLLNEFQTNGIERSSTVIAVGGGVVGDLTGFAASIWLRGVRWINIPTTLLAMVDSSLGGKTGVDLPSGKNLIGSFHSPSLVLADPLVLKTLPQRELGCGLAETLKHAVIDDPGLFDLLTEERLSATLIARSLAVKARTICEDPFEKGRRAVLNLGHTIGHAIEKASHYQIPHGEAVSIGLIAAARLAKREGLTSQEFVQKLIDKSQALGLPTEIPSGCDVATMREALMSDKKRKDGIVRFVLPVALGDVRIDCQVDDPFRFE